MGNERFDNHILSGVRCPTCKGHYSLLKFLGRKEDLYKVLVHCAICDTYGIGTARISDTPPATAEPEQVQTQPLSSPVSADDVLAIHEFLQGFDGNFAGLFHR